MTRLRRFWEDVDQLYTRHIAVPPGVEPQFLILGGFLITFAIVRTITHAIRDGYLFNVSAGGTHIHHLVPGIILLLVSGFVGIGLAPRSRSRIPPVLFGIGAALTLDEFALWLHLQDVYWAPQGRQSIDAIMVTASVIGLGILGRTFWVEVARSAIRHARR